jgi:Holliday junction resolvasome RuvABC DNA-binding subunit
MRTHILRSLKTMVCWLSVVSMSFVIILGFTQTAAAVAERYESKAISVPGITEPVAGRNIEELKEERREWQNRASSLQEAKANDEPESLGEVLNETLNFEEIKAGYHPEDPDETLPRTSSYSH